MVWEKRLVTKAINLCNIVEIRMLSYKRPLCVVNTIIEIYDGDLHTPILLVVHFNMPMNPDWTHVTRAL